MESICPDNILIGHLHEELKHTITRLESEFTLADFSYQQDIVSLHEAYIKASKSINTRNDIVKELNNARSQLKYCLNYIKNEKLSC